MDKIVVLGNCQLASMGGCLRALLPQSDIRMFYSWNLKSPEQIGEVIDELQTANIVFAQPLFHEYGAEISHTLHTQQDKLQIWPAFAFTGFHPDITYAMVEGKLVKSPMDDYHSLIVLGAFLSHLSVDETEQLFNGFVYARLGYYDEYQRAKDAMISMALSNGVNLRSSFSEWEQRGCFVYSINHPKLYVIADIARLVLQRAELSFDPHLLVEDLFDDPLATGCVWPVYPEIAKLLNCQGSLEFKHPFSVFSLREVIAGSFDAYGPLPRGALSAVAGIDRVVEVLNG